METSKNGIALIKLSEGFRAEEYRCSAGVRTIGYGTTRNYPKDRAISESEAHDLLIRDLEEKEDELLASIGEVLTQNQFDAIIDFVYNFGITKFNESTLKKLIQANPNDSEIAAELSKWRLSAGKIENGLVKRRAREIELYFRE